MRRYSRAARLETKAVRGDPVQIQELHNRGFSMTAAFQYGLEFFIKNPEEARAWVISREQEVIREAWLKGTRKGPPGCRPPNCPTYKESNKIKKDKSNENNF